MTAVDAILPVILGGVLLSASPGPAMAYVLSRSVQFGRVGGVASSLGLAVGGMLHALFAALGLSLFVARFPEVLQLVKVAGAAYLAYLAYFPLRDALHRTEKHQSPASLQSCPPLISNKVPFLRLFMNGVIIELSNPKTILFFLSFMPPFVSQYGTIKVFLLCSLIPLAAIPADLLTIFAGESLSRKIGTNPWLVRLVNMLVAIVLIGIALFVLMGT